MSQPIRTHKENAYFAKEDNSKLRKLANKALASKISVENDSPAEETKDADFTDAYLLENKNLVSKFFTKTPS